MNYRRTQAISAVQRGSRQALIIICLLLFPAALRAAVLPLQVASTQRYLVDQSGEPVFIHGEAAWSLIVALTVEEAENYLEDRHEKNFNALIVNLIEHKYEGGDNIYGPPFNRYGNAPFLIPGDLTTPNEDYFAHADRIIDLAAAKGIVVFLAPCYLGYPRKDAGWYEEVLANGEQSCREYGRFLGERYRSKPNLVWLMGGDRNPDDARPMVEAMVEGMLEYDTNHLFSAHTIRQTTAREQYPDSTWLALDAVYPLPPLIYQPCLDAYDQTPPMPVIMIEAWYENEHDMTALDLRRQAYWSILGGSSGHFFGNSPIWLFDPGWQEALDGEGSLNMVHVRNLFLSRAWQLLIPDSGHQVVTAGYGLLNSTNYVTAARTSDGTSAMAYLPEGHEIQVNLAWIAGEMVELWWFDPRTGSASSVGSFPASGSQLLTPPTTEDWVLVMDDAEQNFPPPGSAVLNQPPAVDAGVDQFLLWPENTVTMEASVSDDGKPIPPGDVSSTWSLISGPGSATFSPSVEVLEPTVALSNPGTYVLRLTATDGGLTSFDEVQVTLATNVSPDPPGSLLCEGSPNPIALMSYTPTLSWTFSDPDVGDSQSAYRVSVQNSSGAIVWDSSKVVSEANAAVYSGEPLLEGRSYLWRVRVWDKFDSASTYSETAAFTLSKHSGELLVNGNFEKGDTTGWSNGGGGSIAVGAEPPYGVPPHAGNYQAYWVNSDIGYYAYQNVDLSSYSSEIDNGYVGVDATGWLVCGDYNASPPYDQFLLQIRFLDSEGSEITADRFDTGTQNIATWGKYGITHQLIPPHSRTLQVRFNVWEQGYDAGSADEFSVGLFLPVSLHVLTGFPPEGVLGANYMYQLEAEGGLAPYTWGFSQESAPLPEGLQLAPNGLLSGIPSSTGEFPLVLRVEDNLGTIVETNVDLLIFPEGFALGVAPQTAAEIANTGFQFWFSADTPGEYLIDRSQDLQTWDELWPINFQGGVTNLVDTNAGSSSPLFYRARLP